MSPKLAGLARRFGPAMLVTLFSQGISAVALLSVVLLGTSISDAYALGIQVGTSAFSGVVLQVLYYLAIGRPWMRSWRLWSWLTAAFSILFALGVAVVTTATTGMSTRDAIIVLVFGVGGAFLGLAGVIAVRLACLGRPVMMVGVTIVPNTALALTSVTVRLVSADVQWTAYAPCAVWAVACIGTWIWTARATLPDLPEATPGEGERDGGRVRMAHAATLTIGLVAGTIFPSLFIAALTQLPAGTTTLLFIVSRIGTSLVGLLVNSILTVRFNWHTETASTAPVATWFATASALTGGAAIAVHAAGSDLQLSYALVALAWTTAIIAAPLVVREMHARLMVLATSIKTFADLALVLTAGTWFLANPSISGFFGIYIALQAVALVTAGLSMRRPMLALASIAMFLVGLLQVFLAW